MKYSYNWLKELSGTKKSPSELAELLTMRAFEVEGIEKVGDDTIIEIDVLANRSHDALSHVGMAREIAALEGKKLKYNVETKYIASLKKKRRGGAASLQVEIKDKKLCSRYIGAIMENIEVKESPAWVKVRLQSLGIRPINNIVDAANYVMLELGQPLHAFDLEKVSSVKSQIPNPKSQINPKSKIQNVTIIVRKSKDGEKIKLLDGTEKILSGEDLVIADSEKALAIAGIKGGADAEISEATKAIVLEAANFNSTAVRKSRIRLGLPTDASLRFEKEIDPNLAETAMARVIQIIEMFGGKTQEIADAYPIKARPWKIKLDLNYVNKLLGEKIPVKAISKILKNLGLRVTRFNSARRAGYGLQITVTVPTFRLDLKTQEDLIEEIGRIYGYEKIKSQAPKVNLQAAPANAQRLFERQVKNILAGSGFSEVYNYSFYSVRDAGLAQLGTVKHLKLENPMNPDQALLRVSLIPKILENIRENLKYFKDFRIFETGRVYWSDDTLLPREKRMLVGAIVLEKDRGSENFYEAKGYADNLLNKLGIKNFYYDDFNASPIETFNVLWHESRRAEIKLEGHEHNIGFLGEINPLILADFDVHKRVVMFEFDLEALQRDIQIEKQYKPISKYPTIIRDVSMLSKSKIKVADIIKNIRKTGGNLILDAYLFDIFQKEGKTSYAFHLEFGADRTLESKEVDILMSKIVSTLEKDLKVEVRKG